MLAGSRNRCGSTCFAPTIAAEYGAPHALAWNIGTTGRMVSVHESDITSGMIVAIECSTSDRCVYSTPFGLPVVPDV